ncbi:MAG TPA: hypothetical protein VFD99_00775 [Arthrobacter sp.]|jgi:hypothetical protein|nr:hypothetical protein [Arthrobacter sp.]
MEALTILLAGTILVGVPSTLIAVLRDGRGHTPKIRSTEPWKAGNLPSEPYSVSGAWYLPGARMR